MYSYLKKGREFMIKVSNLHKCYGSGQGRIEVLKGIDLEFEDKKIICVLGPSGSGKSTLLNILGGIENIDDGEVDVLGNKLSTMSKKNWKIIGVSTWVLFFSFTT